MKKLIALSLIVFCQFVFGQQTANLPSLENEDNNVYNSFGLEFKPEYPGGNTELDKYIAKNFKYPKSKEFKGGRIIIQFTIEKDGSINEIKILSDPGFGTAEEAMRVMKNCINWKPGEQNGKKVRCTYVKPILLR